MKNGIQIFGNRKVKTVTLSAAVIGTGAAGYSAALNLYENGVTDIAAITEGVNMGTSRNTGSDKQTYYKKAKEFEGVSIVTQKVSNGFGALEWTLTALLGLLNLAALGGVGYMVFLNVKTSKQIKKLTADSDAADTESEEFPTDE